MQTALSRNGKLVTIDGADMTCLVLTSSVKRSLVGASPWAQESALAAEALGPEWADLEMTRLCSSS